MADTAVEDGSDESVEIAETSVEETGQDPEGFFDDVDTDTGSTVDDPFDGLDEPEEDESGSSSSSKSSKLAEDINRGMARAAVIGLDEEWETDDGETQKKTDLQTEFEETFSAFRFGHYASECAEEYLKVDDDIHPAWGLLGAALICAAVVVYRRPDGDKVIDTVKEKSGRFSAGSALADAIPSGLNSGDNDDE